MNGWMNEWMDEWINDVIIKAKFPSKISLEGYKQKTSYQRYYWHSWIYYLKTIE